MNLLTTEVLLCEKLPVELKNNNTGRGHAHWQSTKQRKLYEQQLRTSGFIRKPFDETVDLVVCRILGKRQRLWDADSVLRGSAKELIDSLVACGWFHDDGAKWIRNCVGIQDDSRKHEGPAVVVTVMSIER